MQSVLDDKLNAISETVKLIPFLNISLRFCMQNV